MTRRTSKKRNESATDSYHGRRVGAGQAGNRVSAPHSRTLPRPLEVCAVQGRALGIEVHHEVVDDLYSSEDIAVPEVPLEAPELLATLAARSTGILERQGAQTSSL